MEKYKDYNQCTIPLLLNDFYRRLNEFVGNEDSLNISSNFNDFPNNVSEGKQFVLIGLQEDATVKNKMTHIFLDFFKRLYQENFPKLHKHVQLLSLF